MCALGEQGSVWQNGQIWTYLGKLLGGASGNTRPYKSWYWNKVAMIIHNPRNPPSLPHLPTPPPDAKSPTGDAPGRSASSSLLFSWIFEVESLKLNLWSWLKTEDESLKMTHPRRGRVPSVQYEGSAQIPPHGFRLVLQWRLDVIFFTTACPIHIIADPPLTTQSPSLSLKWMSM